MLNNVANSGENTGAIVGENKGTINIIQTTNQYNKLPSLIVDLIKCFADVCINDSENQPNDTIVFRHDQKLEYNHIIKYKEIIMDYAIFWEHCEDALNLYDNSNIGAKKKILLCVKTWYQEIKGDLLLNNKSLNAIEVIRSNSDTIIDLMKYRLLNLVNESNSNISTNEDVELGINCFICYCFMQCKILEKPV